MRVFILKPDAIGDFILATGCIRLMARELSEKNLVIAVRADVAPLAKAQFPKAEVIPLHLREKRRLVNLATVNVVNCLPAWLRLLTLRVDAAICLRSMRAYLHTITFYLPRAKRRIACENLLLATPRMRRPAVENFVRSAFNPTLLPYPAAGKLPTDIEANRLVAERFLNRKVTDEEILPTLRPPRGVSPKNHWLLCPFSSSKAKDFSAEAWARALKILDHERAEVPLHLAAGPSQADRLQDFARTLQSAGITNIHLSPPVPLPDFLQSIAEARLVLTVDTASAHMACALDTPAVIVSAGQHPGVYAPYSKIGRQKWLLPPPELSKNEWRQHFTPEMVAGCMREVLAFSGRKS
ncbi:MAG: glycosyltransferase family 9 protein [Spartobacteria bacterium]